MRTHHLHLACMVDNLKDFVLYLTKLTVVTGVLETLINKWLTEKLNHDQRSHTLENIPTGSTAAVLDHRSNTWTVGQVLDRNERRYKVELPTGQVIHRNCVDLRPTSVEFQCIPNIPVSSDMHRTPDPVPATMDTKTVSTSPKAPTPKLTPKSNASKPVVKPTVGIAKSTTITSSKVTTCSGRVVKPPTKLNL